MSVDALDLLRIISGQASEQQHADEAHDHVHGARPQEQVDQHRNQQTDHAHDQERAEARQILLGRVSPQAKARKGRRRREECLRNRRTGINQQNGG